MDVNQPFFISHNVTQGSTMMNHLMPQQSEKLIALFEKAEFYYNNPCRGRNVYLKIILAEILLFVNELYSQSSGNNPTRNELEYNKIKPVLEYIYRPIKAIQEESYHAAR